MDTHPSLEFDSAWTLKKHDHFLRGLRKAPGTRTDLEIAAMVDELSSNPFLNRFEATGQLVELCRVIELKTYEHNQTIFEQGDIGDSFFIIHSGAVAVYVNTNSESIEAVQRLKVAEYRKGQSFGDLSLLYSQPRAATVITLEPSELICLHKEPFDKVVKSMQEQQISRAYNVISASPIFESVEYDIVHHLARTCYLKRYSPGQIIEGQDAVPLGLYIIQKGLVKLTRKLEFRATVSGTIEELAKKPAEDEEVKVIEVTIDELSDGHTFCDYAILNNKAMQYSALCTMPTYVYFIERKNVTNLKSDAFWQMQRQSKPYPNDTALRKLYFEQRRWRLYKRKVVQDVKFEKKLKKP
mmetsp:Transcript_31117/g.54079  ORF Transcript_31117/g.54079 Transcript_31117/m.54079 type:complete len:354 (+) Transcript_31117:55-1116(+)